MLPDAILLFLLTATATTTSALECDYFLAHYNVTFQMHDVCECVEIAIDRQEDSIAMTAHCSASKSIARIEAVWRSTFPFRVSKSFRKRFARVRLGMRMTLEDATDDSDAIVVEQLNRLFHVPLNNASGESSAEVTIESGVDTLTLRKMRLRALESESLQLPPEGCCPRLDRLAIFDDRELRKLRAYAILLGNHTSDRFKSLNFDNTSLTSFHVDAFRSLTNSSLDLFAITRSLLRTPHRSSTQLASALSTFRHIHLVNLSSNHLDSLYSHVQAPPIDTLSVSNNRIDVVTAAAFWNPLELTALDLSSNYIQTVAPLGSSIRRLRLQYNRLERLPQRLASGALAAIDARENELSTVQRGELPERVWSSAEPAVFEGNPFWCANIYFLACWAQMRLGSLKAESPIACLDDEGRNVSTSVYVRKHLLQSGVCHDFFPSVGYFAVGFSGWLVPIALATTLAIGVPLAAIIAWRLGRRRELSDSQEAPTTYYGS